MSLPVVCRNLPILAWRLGKVFSVDKCLSDTSSGRMDDTKEVAMTTEGETSLPEYFARAYATEPAHEPSDGQRGDE